MGEDAEGRHRLAVAGVDQVRVAPEVCVETAVNAFIGIVGADHPAELAFAVGAQAELLSEDVDVIVEVDVRFIEARAVPVVELAAREGLVGGDRGQVGPAQIGLDAGADVEAVIVAEGLGVQADPGDSRHGGRDAPAGDAPGGILGIGYGAARDGVGAKQAEAASVRLVDRIGGGQIDGEVFAGVPGQTAAHGGLVEVAQLLAGVAMVLPGAALFGDGGQAAQQVGSDLARNIALDLVAVVAAVFGVEAGLEVGRRGVGDDVDGAAGGVAAIEGALRAAQHLHAGDVEQGALCGHRIGVGDFIDIDADGRGVVRGVFARADAANAELGLAAAELAVDLHIGDGVLQVVDDRDAFFVQLLPADDAQRDAHVLAGLFTTLGCDDDVVDRGGTPCLNFLRLDDACSGDR
ncbi:hypothetical protein D3C72_892060 [compost metagenome]